MRNLTKLFIFSMMLLLASPVYAKLAGYNVILVHGFQAGDLASKPTGAQINTNGSGYWSAFWGGKAEGYLNWPSHERIEGKIIETMYAQAKDLATRKVCDAGCIFVTHSTGDLALRYFLQYQAQWFAKDGLTPLKALLVLDFAGAGGGTEIANIGVGIVAGVGSTLEKEAIKAWLGFLPSVNASALGVMNDLQTSVSRNEATTPNDTPRLRFVGMGWAYAGVTRPFISGNDDSVVPPHSSCGSAAIGDFDSCSSSVGSNGKLGSNSAPAALRTNHYAVLMGDNANHGETISVSETDGTLTFVNNNFSVAGKTINFSTKTESRGGLSVSVPVWGFCGFIPCIKSYYEQVIVAADKYQFISASGNSAFSPAVFNALN